MADEGEKKFEGLGDEEWFGDAETESDVFFGRSPSSPADRRASRRQRVQIEARVDPGARPGTVHDISANGVLLLLDSLFPAGTQVEVTLFTEYGPAGAKGTVRWASRTGMNDLSVTRISMGVQFTSVSEELKKFLEVVLEEAWKGLAGVAPGKGSGTENL